MEREDTERERVESTLIVYYVDIIQERQELIATRKYEGRRRFSLTFFAKRETVVIMTERSTQKKEKKKDWSRALSEQCGV